MQPHLELADTADGCSAAVWVESHISQAACAFPITPSTPMGVAYQRAVANGKCNVWGERLTFFEPESEHSSATACEGFALAGGRVTNFTSGQGLILMKEVLYVISGKRLPMVFHIGARALTRQALNVHAGHDDCHGVADTGWGMLFARNAQEVVDLTLIARRVAESTLTPFFCVQDGFFTTHTVENIDLPSPSFMEGFVGAPRLSATFDPLVPRQSGVVQNPDTYMEGRLAQRSYTERVLPALQTAMADLTRQTGRRHGLVEVDGMENADLALVGMGSMMETAAATADYLRVKCGVRVGTMHVTSFRPFPASQIVEALAGVPRIAIVERMEAELASDGPLTTEVKAAFASAAAETPGYPAISKMPRFFSGCAGLGGRDVRPGDFLSLVDVMRDDAAGKRHFALGARHADALPRFPDPDLLEGACVVRGHSVGGLGWVSSNKLLATMLARLADVKVQAWSMYGSEKKGLPTTCTLIASPRRVRTHCPPQNVDVVSVYDPAALRSPETLDGLRDGGTLCIQTSVDDPARLWDLLPASVREAIMKHNWRLLYVNPRSVAPSGRAVMSGMVALGTHLRCLPFLRAVDGPSVDPPDDVMAMLKTCLVKQFGGHDETLLRNNLEAARGGWTEIRELEARAHA